MRIHLIIITALLLSIPCRSFGADPTRITWVRVKSAPFYIFNSDEVCTGGFAYDIEKLLRDNLPEYEHQPNLMNLKRAAKLMREGTTTCAPFLIRTPEREAFMAFSIPAIVLFPNSVIVRADDKRFADKGSVSLQALLENATLRGGISTDRSYGKTIDTLLAPYKDTPSLYISYGRGVLDDQLRQLFAGRVDYVIGYPMEAAYITSHFGNNQTSVSLPVVENAGRPLKAAVACSDTETGREIIDKVNTIIQEHLPTEAYLDFFTPYVAPADQKAYRQLFKATLLNN